MTPPPPADDTDSDSLLDILFERFVADLGAGRAVDLAVETAARPDLRSRIAETLALATEIAFAQPVARPVVAGHEIVAELGRGGMGAVYLALERGLGRRVALKVLPRAFAAGPRGRERFLREARAVARLEHPHIVRVYELGEEDGAPWFTMEWIDGRTLAQAVADGRVTDPRDAARIALEIARALVHAHAAGVVHRDVKPSNVMLRADGRALLFDFGLAAVEAEASLTLTGTFVGTPHYASPEQAQGRADLDARTDVWSLGATLYEMLARRPPFTGATTAEVLRRVQHEEPPDPCAVNPAVPRDLGTVCLTALEKDPARRYVGAAEIAADLERFLAGEPVAARPVGPLGRAVRWVRRKPLAATSAALAVLLVGGTPTGLWLQQRAATETITAERDKAREFSAALAGIFRSVAPEARGESVRVVEVLEAAAADARTKPPELRAPLLVAIGTARLDVDAVDAAARDFEDALAAAGHGDGGDDAVRFDAHMSLGSARLRRGRLAEAEAQFRAASAIAPRLAGRADAPEFDAARCLAETLGVLGRVPEALALAESSLRDAEARLGADHPVALLLRHQIGYLTLRGGDARAALARFEDTAARRARVLGADHTDTLNSLAYVARCSRITGDLARAESAARACVDRLAARGIDNHQACTARLALAAVLLDRERWAGAVREARLARDAFVRRHGDRDTHALAAAVLLGRALAAGGDAAGGVAELRPALERSLAALGPDDPRSIDATVALGEALRCDGDLAAAEPLLRDALARCAGRETLRGPERAAQRALAAVCESTGRPEEAARFRTDAERGEAAR